MNDNETSYRAVAVEFQRRYEALRQAVLETLALALDDTLDPALGLAQVRRELLHALRMRTS